MPNRVVTWASRGRAHIGPKQLLRAELQKLTPAEDAPTSGE